MMKIKIEDLNSDVLYQTWHDSLHKPNSSGVYVWEIKEMILNGKVYDEKFDAYIFLWDDGKGKHESYEVNFVVPYDPVEDNVLVIDHTWYGANQKEAIENFKQGIKETFEKFRELCIAGRKLHPYIFDQMDERIK